MRNNFTGDFAEIEEIEDENSMVTRPSQKYQLVDKSSTKTTKRKMTTISSTNDANQQEQQQSSNKPSLLKKEGVLVKEVGVTQMEYFSDKMPLGILHFYITSEGNSTGARVFITSGGRMNGFFPKLPKNNRVQIINITTNSVSLEWDQSPSGNLFKKGDVDYCLVLSDTHEFHSYCESYSYSLD